MGISAFILFEKNKSSPINELLGVLKKISTKKKWDEGLVEEKFENIDGTRSLKYQRINIRDIAIEESTDRQICVDIYDEPYIFNDVSFEWYDENKDFFRTISIEHFEENKDLLLQITYDFITQYPEAVLWIGEDWFYTLEDLKKIKEQPFDEEWCYKNPKEMG